MEMLSTDQKSNENYFMRKISVDSLPSEEVLCIDQKFECDVGCVVWDSALVLAKYLDHRCTELGLSSAHVVELGAGTGFCGLFAATLGSNAIITDLSYCLDLMNRNVENNKQLISDRVVVKEFDWSETDPQKEYFFDWRLDRIDYIVVSDCVYYEQSVQQLYETIVWLSSKGATVLLSYEDRDDKQSLIDHFFKLIKDKFKVYEIPTNQLHPDYCSSDLHLFKLTQIC